MSNWQHTTLGKIASIITGPFGSQLHQADYVDNGIPIVMPQNIDDRKINYDAINYIGEKDALRLKKYRAVENDILYARRGDIEKHAFITKRDEGVYCGTGCLRVRLTSPDVDPLFLSLFLNKAETKKWLVTHAVGSNMPNLNTDILAAVPVSYPSIEWQREIAQVLNSLDEKIAINNRINDNLQQMVNTIYNYWFTQFDFPNTEGKPYRSSGGKMVWNQALKRKVPEGWVVSNLGELSRIVATSITPKPTVRYHHFSIPAFDDNHMPVHEYGSNIDSNKYVVKDDYILVSKLNPKFKRIWTVSRAPENSICSTEFMPFVSKGIEKEYLYGVLNSNEFYTFMVNSSSSSTGSRKRMSPELCLLFQTVYPQSEDIIRKYCEIVKPLLAQMQDLVVENYKLIELRDFLLPPLMNGQASVVT